MCLFILILRPGQVTIASHHCNWTVLVCLSSWLPGLWRVRVSFADGGSLRCTIFNTVLNLCRVTLSGKRVNVAGNRVTGGGFVRNCGYTRTMLLTFYSSLKFSRRATLVLTSPFNNKVNEVHRIYNAIAKVCVTLNLTENCDSDGSGTSGGHICARIRRLTREFGRSGNSVVYHSLLNVETGTGSGPAPSREARGCCTTHPYPRLYECTTSLLSRCLGGGGN